MDETLTLQPAQQSQTRRAGLGLLAGMILLASLGWFAAGIKDMALIDRDEPMIAEVARQMVQRGEWLTPHLPAWEDKSIFKPPLAMWVMAGSFKVFGINEFAARVPSAICAALTATLLFAVAGRRWGWSAGLVAAACMAVSLLPTVVGHMAVTDSLLTLLATVILLCLEKSLRMGGCRSCNVTMWVVAGAAMLIKGPAILAFFGPPLVIAGDRYRWRRYLVLAGTVLAMVVCAKTGLLEDARLGTALKVTAVLVAAFCMLPVLRLPVGAIWGVPLMLAMCGWWFVYVSSTSTVHEESAKRFILFEVLKRIAQPMESHWGPPGYYLAVLAGGLLPFTAGIVPLATWSRQHRREDDTRSLLWAWAIGSWVLCEISSTKLPHYILPAMPALALLAAMWWRQAEDLDTPISRKRAFGLVLPVGLFAGAVGVMACIAWHQGLRIWLGEHLLDKKPEIWERIAYLGKLEAWQTEKLLAAPGLLLLTAAAGFLAARRWGLRRGLVLLACGWAPAMMLLLVALTSRSEFNESLSRRAARRAMEIGEPGETVVKEAPRYFAVGYTEPALFFYLPADRYVRVEGRKLAELAEIDVPFVLIANGNLEGGVRGRFGPRVERCEVVSGLNTAKGGPDKAYVFRIQPTAQVKAPASRAASQPGSDSRN